jgi:NAD dependent epimerase/dehydratase
VTGAGGFIGSHLVERLVAEGCRVRAFVRYNSLDSWGCLAGLPRDRLRHVEVVAGDVRDPYGVRTAMAGQEIVFHLAALIGIPFSYHAPETYVDTNVRGTLNVLQAARDLGTERVLVASTSEVYGTARQVPIDESHPRRGQSPYAATKIGADALAESFHRSFGLPVVIVRPFNTYGPRQSARAVIPTIIRQLLSGAAEIRLGSLETTRDLVFVEDTVDGFVEIARSPGVLGEEINIATGAEISIGELARALVRRVNPAATVVTDPARVRPEKSEVERLLGSAAKLMRLTGWRPRHTLDEGLGKTIAWFREGDGGRVSRPDRYTI